MDGKDDRVSYFLTSQFLLDSYLKFWVFMSQSLPVRVIFQIQLELLNFHLYFWQANESADILI